MSPEMVYPTSERFLDTILVLRRPLVVLLHLGLIALSNYLAFWLRFDGAVPDPQAPLFGQMLPWLLLIRGLTFLPFRLYEGLWRYTSVWDVRNIIAGVASSSVAFYVLVHFGLHETAYSRSIFMIDTFLLIGFMSGVRLTHRVYRELLRKEGRRRVLIYGAGDAGEKIVRDMRATPDHPYEPVGFIDDNRAKVGLRIHGVPVLGTRDDLPHIMATKKPVEVLVAIPRADPVIFRKVVRALDRYNVPIKTLPSLRDILDDKVDINQIRDVSAQDLLSRGPAGLDQEPLRDLLAGRRVMVTGASGSIGAELSRQVVNFQTRALVLFDHAENGLYDIANELADRGHHHGIHSVVGDVTDRARVEQVLRQHQIEIVFHAAAHKHVPLMEANLCEAVKNNVSGTRTMVEAAERWGVDRFVLISTDKAVNPTSVMGVTKRIGELLLQRQCEDSNTTFITVRFGNVLGSTGSMVPRFLQQIKAGGPVTVTHPDVRRFFMLIPEAVQLVLQAAAHGEAGKLYVLEMGEQIKIVDMARDVIRLAGFIPEEEIPITFVGLRPGEKLFEELVGSDERAAPSSVEQIMEVESVALPDADTLDDQLEELERVAMQNDNDAVELQLGVMVPAFRENRDHPPEMPQSESAFESALAQSAHDEPAREVVSSSPNAGQTCPECGLERVYRSPIKTRLERIRRSVSMMRPYRCETCQWRGWLTPMESFRAAEEATAATSDPDLASLDHVAGAENDDRPAFSPRTLDLP